MKLIIDINPGSARRLAAIGVTLLIVCGAAIGNAVPVKFSEGDILTHTQLNQNFDNVESRLAALEGARWAVAGNVVGVGPSRSTGASLPLLETSAPALTLSTIVATGFVAAQIPCSGGQAPTGSTCASGDEVYGVSFVPPTSGMIEACFTMPVTAHVPPTAGIAYGRILFDIVETETTSSTPKAAPSRLFSVESGNDSGGKDHDAVVVPVCELFKTTKGEQMTLRVRNGLDYDGNGTVISLDVAPINTSGTVPFIIRPVP